MPKKRTKDINKEFNGFLSPRQNMQPFKTQRKTWIKLSTQRQKFQLCKVNRGNSAELEVDFLDSDDFLNDVEQYPGNQQHTLIITVHHIAAA